MNYIFLYIYLYIFINRVNHNCELYTYMEYSDIFEHKFIHELGIVQKSLQILSIFLV